MVKATTASPAHTTPDQRQPVRKKRKYDSAGARRTRIENRRRALLGLPKLKRQRVTNRPYRFSGKYRGKNGVEKRKYKKRFLNGAETLGEVSGKKNVSANKSDAKGRAATTQFEPVFGKVPTTTRRLAPVEV